MDIQVGQKYGLFDKDGLEGVYRVCDVCGLYVELVNVRDKSSLALCGRQEFERAVQDRTWRAVPPCFS